MECPSCHSFNPEGSIICGLCSLPLSRPERPAPAELALDGPMVGPSYTLAAPQNEEMKQYARQASLFLALTLLLQGGLIAMVYLAPMLGERLAAGDGASGTSLTWWVVGVYSMFVFAFAVGQTSHAIGLGFWPQFALALLPPLVPAALARAGSRSVPWTYAYLAIDVMIIAGALKFFEFVPVLMFLVLIIELPLVIYHLTGCGIGNIGASLGLNLHAVVIWACGLPLALLFYAVIQVGVADALVEALVSGGSVDPLVFHRLLDPTLFHDSYALTVTVALWAAVGWIFWLKGVYESLRYPLF